MNTRKKCIDCGKRITKQAKRCRCCASSAKPPIYKFTSNQVKTIINLYKNEYSCQEIALKLKTNAITVTQYLERNGIKRRHRHTLKSKAKMSNTHTLKISKTQLLKAIESDRVRGWKRYRVFRKDILKRDNYTCQICGGKGKAIHHKKKAKLYPELFFSFYNVITICQSCHSRIHRIMTVKMYKNKIEKLEKIVKKYKSISLLDDLTELYNRRKLDHDINRYLHLQDRYKINFMIVMIDVDGLKKINDDEGHKHGDIMLKRVAHSLKNNTRAFDKAYRIGGDEFCLILSHSNKEDKHILERIRKELGKHKIEISIGCSKLCDNVLEIADQRMYIEKRRKRK